MRIQSDVLLQHARLSGQSFELFEFIIGVEVRSQQLHLPLFSLFVSQQLHPLYFEFIFLTMYGFSGITANARFKFQ